jgi:polyisoprenyl-teichoic acid--peptidoglycan teichoic acid transferase
MDKNEFKKSSNLEENFEIEDDYMKEVKTSLAQQITSEMSDREKDNPKEIPERRNRGNKDKKKQSKGTKIVAAVLSCCMLVILLLLFTPGGKKLLITIASNHFYKKLTYEDITKAGENESSNPEPTDIPVKTEKDIINILLIGVEELDGASNTDTMIIASLNNKDKTIKLISVLRDLYVTIPGHANNKLNAAYSLTGMAGLYQTYKDNFGVNIDGYVMMNFEAFEQLVDLVDGVDVTLTAKEASYLNKNNYISDPANRNVHEGVQHMNGNQALGYCRIRRVSNGSESYDFGRTKRQRTVLNSIFEKVMKMNVIQQGFFINNVLDNIDINTDITKEHFNDYLNIGLSLKIKELENYRIPADKTYDSVTVKIGRLNQLVLIPLNWEETRADMHQLIYGKDDTTTQMVLPEKSP